MISYKTGQLSQKEQKIIETIIQEITDIYSDFYITKNNLRLYIPQNIHLFYDGLKQGDKIVYSPEEGIILVTGFSDNAKRKYLKILAKNEKAAERLLSVLFWNIKCDLWIKLKQNNPLVKVLQSIEGYEDNRLKFKIRGYRGKEILLYKKYRKWNEFDKGDQDAIKDKDQN